MLFKKSVDEGKAGYEPKLYFDKKGRYMEITYLRKQFERRVQQLGDPFMDKKPQKVYRHTNNSNVENMCIATFPK